MAVESPLRIHITHDVNRTSSFEVTISRFQPGPDDAVVCVSTDAAGNKMIYGLPPYYISDMAGAAQSMRKYARDTRPEVTRAILANSNPIVRKTFAEAERYYTVTKVSYLLPVGNVALHIFHKFSIC